MQAVIEVATKAQRHAEAAETAARTREDEEVKAISAAHEAEAEVRAKISAGSPEHLCFGPNYTPCMDRVCWEKKKPCGLSHDLRKLLDAIGRAKKSLFVAMYVFTDPDVAEAIASVVKKPSHPRVCVILDRTKVSKWLMKM